MDVRLNGQYTILIPDDGYWWYGLGTIQGEAMKCSSTTTSDTTSASY